MARPANQVASVSWAVPGAGPKLASTAGKAGRYMSVAAGPTAMNRPSRVGSQVGWVVFAATWMLIRMRSCGWLWMNVVPAGGFVSMRRAGKPGRGQGRGVVGWFGGRRVAGCRVGLNARVDRIGGLAL